MEENLLEERKLNIIEKLQKRFLVRKLSKNGEFDDWKKIGNEKLKYDQDIMNFALEIVKKTSDVSLYKEFPITIQIEKGLEDRYIIRYLQDDVQMEIAKKDETAIEECRSEVRQKLAIEDPNKYLKRLRQEEQIKVLRQKNELINLYDEYSQKRFIEIEPKLILFCPKAVKEKILRHKPISSGEWQAIIKHEENMTIGKLIKIFENSESYKYEKIKEIFNLFENSTKKKQLVEQIKELDSTHRKEIDDLLLQGTIKRIFTQETESVLFETIIENIKMSNMTIGLEAFREKTIIEKFAERYGIEKLQQYGPIIKTENKLNYEIDERLLTLFFGNETIIEKCDPSKMVNYITLHRQYEKAKKDRKNRRIYEIPKSEKITQEKLRIQFQNIIKDVYGEKALKIVEKRPGLDLLNISNLEVFSKAITDNFREGFIDDLLSYNIKKSNEFLRLAQNPEELNAFKLYYDRMSKKLGENVVTMQMCISRYDQYSEILKQASQSELTEEQLEEMDKICSWPVNICNIKHLEEMNGLSQKLKSMIMKERSWQEERILDEKIDEDVFSINLPGESIIYDYVNLSDEELDGLSDQEKETFKFLQEQARSRNFKSGGLITSLDLVTLKEACKEGIDISSVFLNLYTSRIKLKEEKMKQFNGEMTNEKKIDEAIRNGIFGVKKMVINGVELIDLGNMPAYFAMHNPTMNNSHIPKDGPVLTSEGLNQYLKYEGSGGISTISARPITGAEDELGNEIQYIYWDFSDNEIMSLMENREGYADGRVSHEPKRVIAKGNSDTRIKGYKKMINGKEIAFYRRHRNHDRIEKENYGGKVIPNAITGRFDKELVKIALKRFGGPIPIFIRRNMLSSQEGIEKASKIINKAIEEIRKENIIGQNMNKCEKFADIGEK